MGLLSVVPLPYRLLAMAVAALALVAFGWFKGNEHGTAKLTEYIGAQAREGVRIVTKQGAVTERVRTVYVKAAAATTASTEEVKKEVQTYAQTNRGFTLDPRWRLLHDAAATDALPDAAGAVDGTVGAPTAAEALETVTTNYGACNRTADRLDALQDWVRQQQAVK